MKSLFSKLSFDRASPNAPLDLYRISKSLILWALFLTVVVAAYMSIISSIKNQLTLAEQDQMKMSYRREDVQELGTESQGSGIYLRNVTPQINDPSAIIVVEIS